MGGGWRSRSPRAIPQGRTFGFCDARVFGTPEYFLYDPRRRKLEGFRQAAPGICNPLLPDDRGRLWSEQLGAFLGLWHGTWEAQEADWIRLFRPDGSLVPTKDEAEGQRAEAGERKATAESLRAEAAERKATTEPFPPAGEDGAANVARTASLVEECPPDAEMRAGNVETPPSEAVNHRRSVEGSSRDAGEPAAEAEPFSHEAEMYPHDPEKTARDAARPPILAEILGPHAERFQLLAESAAIPSTKTPSPSAWDGDISE